MLVLLVFQTPFVKAVIFFEPFFIDYKLHPPSAKRLLSIIFNDSLTATLLIFLTFETYEYDV